MVNVIFSLVGSNGDEIVFDDEGDFHLSEGISGIGLPPTGVTFAESASDGALWRSSKRGIRDVDLPIYVFGESQADVEGNLRRLANLLSDRKGGTILRASYANNEVWELTDGHYVAGAESVRNSGSSANWMRWVISLQFANPFWVRSEPESLTIASSEASRSLIPNLAEMRITGSQVTGSFAIENSGDVDSYPKWTFRGPIDSVTVSDNAGKSFSYDAAISASETVVIDTEKGTVANQAGVNKYGSLGVSPKLFTLPSGVSQVSVVATGTSPGIWNDAETLNTNLVTNPSMETVASGTTILRTNLCTNPSFEVDATGWGAVTGATISRVTSQSYSGAASLQVVSTALNGYINCALSVPLASTTYTLSMWVKGEAGKLFEIGLVERTSGDVYVDEVRSGNITATGSWQRVSVSNTFGSTGALARLQVFNRTAGAHTFFVDAVLLEQTDEVRDYFDGATTDALGWDYGWSGTANASTSTAKASAVTVRTNLVPNPSFETNTTGWATGSPATVTRVTTEFYSGSASIQVAATGIDGRASTESIAVSASTTYTASVWVKGEVGKSINLNLRELNSSQVNLGDTTTSVTATGAWQRITATRTLGSTGAFCQVIVRNATAGAHTYYVDAALLETGSTAGDYFDGSTGVTGSDIYANAWTGTAHASTSVQYGVQVATISGTAPYAVAIQSSGWKSSGSRSLRIVPKATHPDSFAVITLPTASTMAGKTYTVMAKLKLDAPLAGSLDARALKFVGMVNLSGGGTQTITTSTAGTNTAGEQIYRGTFTVPDTATTWSFSRIYNGASAGNGDVWWDDLLVVEGDYTGDYFDGDTVSNQQELGYAWTGTAHASTSIKKRRALTGATLITCNYQPRKEVVH